MSTEINKPVSELTATELEELLRQKKAETQQAEQAAKKAYEKEKEDFLSGVFESFQHLQQQLKGLKESALNKAKKLNERKYTIEGKEAKEGKYFELKNNHIKVIVETQERFGFTDEAIVHINAIKDIFKSKFEARNKGFYNLLDGLLLKNSKGEYDPKLLIKIRKQAKELGEESLINEVDKLYDCQILEGTTQYLRVYQKDKNNRWQDISLNFSRY